MDKDFIRRRVKARKNLLEPQERHEAARRVFNRIEQMAAFVMANRILIYNSLPDELSTKEFIERWATRKTFYLPRVNGLDLEILPYSPESSHKGAFGIIEPDGSDIHDITEMEMIIVPGVAYDRTGSRIGRGRGFYDRLLCRSNAMSVGVAYDFQIFDAIPTEPHDVAVDWVVCESAAYRRSR